jgi:5-methylcytosine-specific restriction endonuclease McrA
MAFSEATKDEAYKRSGGRCECTRLHPGITSAPHHGGRCTTTFTRYGNWEAHHKTAVSSGGSDNLSNCEVLCKKCHELTGTYGNH